MFKAKKMILNQYSQRASQGMAEKITATTPVPIVVANPIHRYQCHCSYGGRPTVTSRDSHEGEKFLTTRRQPSLFLDGTCVAVVTGSEPELGVGVSVLVSIPMSVCWSDRRPGIAGALTAGLSMNLL